MACCRNADQKRKCARSVSRRNRDSDDNHPYRWAAAGNKARPAMVPSGGTALGGIGFRRSLCATASSNSKCLLRVIFDASSTRKPLPQLTSKPKLACNATSDAVG
jgi:hypothetical protein